MERARPFRRGTSILPSLFTTGNLFLGFWSIVKTLDGRFAEAAPLIGGAVILDMLDGRIARLTNTQSEFGAEYDSLADAVSFGVAPALLAYCWALQTVPRAGWPAAFLFLACGVLRLARFNVQKHVVDARFFVGLPIPAGAAQIAAIVFVLPDRPTEHWQTVAVLALVVALAFLMVSTFRYRSFKGVDLRRRRSYISVLGIALLFLLVATQPEASLLAATSLYTAVGAARRGRFLPAPPRRSAAARWRSRSPRREPRGARRRSGGRRGAGRAGPSHPARQAAPLRPLGGPGRHRRARGDPGRGPRARDGGGDGPPRRADRGPHGLRSHRARGRAGRVPLRDRGLPLPLALRRGEGGVGRPRRGVGDRRSSWPATTCPPKALEVVQDAFRRAAAL